MALGVEDGVSIDGLPVASVGNPSDKAVISQNGITKSLALLLFPVSTPQANAIGARQLASEKGQANGYASLNSSGRVPIAQLGSGTPTGLKFLRDDGVFAVPPSSGGGSPGTVGFNSITGVPSDNSPLNAILTAKQDSSAKGNANGYASLGSNSLVPAAQLGTGGSSTDFLRKDGTWQTVGTSAVAFASLTGVATDNTSLASILSGKQATIAYTTENAANKATSLASPDNTKYPTTQAIVNALGAYAPLVSGKVPIANLGTGAPDGTKFLRDDGTFAVPAGGGGTTLPSQIGQSGKFLTTNGSTLSWGTPAGGGGGGSAVVPFTSTAYASTLNVDFGSTGSNVDFTSVNGDFTITGTNISSGAERVILIRKTTASPITINIDPTTLSPSSRQGLTTLVSSVDGSPDKFVVNAPINSVLRLFIYIEGASGSLIPDIQLSMLGTDNAINVTANYYTFFVDHATYSSSFSDTNEHILLTVPLPANKLKANSYLNVLVDFNRVSGSGQNQLKVRLGTTGLSSQIIEDYGNNQTGTIERGCRLNVVSSTAQKVKVGWALDNPVAEQDKTVNLAVDNNLYFTIAKGASGNAVGISGIKVEIGNAS